MTPPTVDPQFLQEVLRGLQSPTKSLPSKYFYDAVGDELFVKIMHLPEYYLTRAELSIFQKQASSIIKELTKDIRQPFHLIELGAGDGTKTKELLKELILQDFQFIFKPVDISQHVLEVLQKNLLETLPQLRIEPLAGDYFDKLGSVYKSGLQKIVLFLGSNLGNMQDHDAKAFLNKISNLLHSGDQVLLGLDLIKPRSIVLPAYNDSKGVTAAFNLNLLERINRELMANFETDQFEHAPDYDEEVGIATSGLKSLVDQIVHIGPDQVPIHFEAGEIIHTEISRKYNREILEELLVGTDLAIREVFYDDAKWFADFVLQKK